MESMFLKVVNAVCVSIWGWDFILALYPGMVIRRPPVARSRCPDGILESPVARSRCADGIIVMSSYHGDGGQGQNCVGRVPSPSPRRGKPSGPNLRITKRLIHGKDGGDTRTRNASLAGSRGRPGTVSAGRCPYTAWTWPGPSGGLFGGFSGPTRRIFKKRIHLIMLQDPFNKVVKWIVCFKSWRIKH